MDVKLLIQRDGKNTLKDELLKKSSLKKLKKFYCLIGGIKETGYEIFEEFLIDNKARKNFVIGFDKKYTTKRMLEGLLGYTKNIWVYNNNSLIEFCTNIFVFEEDIEATVYTFSGNVSDTLMNDDILMYNKISYKLNDKIDNLKYQEYINMFLTDIKNEGYIKLNKELIEELTINKEIFTTKRYNHNVMSISEMLDNKEEENIKENKAKIKIPKVNLDLKDLEFNIDIEDETKKEKDMFKDNNDKKEVKDKKDKKEKLKEEKRTKKDKIVEETEENSELFEGTLNIENMLFEKSNIKLDRRKIQKENQEEAKAKAEDAKNKATTNKKIDLDKVSNVFMELKDKPSKGREITSLLIPNQIKKLIPNFFETKSDSINMKKEDGTYKEQNITLEIVDVKNSRKLKDENAYISSKIGKTHTAIVSEKFSEINYVEKDIARIVKLSDCIYHVEIISKDIEEYILWKKACNQILSGSDRRYGVM